MPEPDLHTLADYIRSIAPEVEALMPDHAAPAQLHLWRASRFLECAAAAMAAAAIAQRTAEAAAPIVIVSSPAADRVRALIASIPQDVVSVSTRLVLRRLTLPETELGERVVGELLKAHGWHLDIAGWWHRPGTGVAADVIVAEERGR